MTSTISKDANQGNESYSSKEADSTTKEEEQKLKTTKHQLLVKTCKQLTLLILYRSTKSDSKAMEDEIGILVHETSYLGPRTLLCIIKNPWKTMVKVSQPTASPEQNRAQLMTSTDQLTLRTCARTSLDSLGDSKGRFGIFALGSTYHDSRLLLTTIGRSLDKWMKVTHSTAGAEQYRIDLMTRTPCEAWFERIV